MANGVPPNGIAINLFMKLRNCQDFCGFHGILQRLTEVQ
ncbi:hypothetical protein T4B_14006 [Trichinella pseudospiralis]|uniref:Uncharacterized protein n=1 Tax=Trichinella pseudospiralis TaxID=6337 RepID=A0A0V1GEE8_TRIPS|nr:hypothetical protein T4B_14006 [Trichinella pseudospiralis]